MFETLMTKGGYRIDLVNRKAGGTGDALGFYVRGDLAKGVPYSLDAKHHLYAGLDAIRKYHDEKNLYAVYLDIDRICNLARPAYLQLKRDLLYGAFRKVFVFSPDDLLGCEAAIRDLVALYRRVKGFELITEQQGILTPIPLQGEAWVVGNIV